MKIRSLLIENFRGIQRVAANDLGETIVIAGQNGSGKSCIFDAIRLLKTAYGGYVQNEFEGLLIEHQIGNSNLNANFDRLLNEKTKICIIQVHFEISETEKVKLKSRLNWFLRVISAPENSLTIPGRRQWPQSSNETADFAKILDKERFEIEASIDAGQIVGKIMVEPSSNHIMVEQSRPLEFICKNYHPEETGIFYYLGPQRLYPKTSIQSFSYNPAGWHQQETTNALSSNENKFASIKQEIVNDLTSQFLGMLEGNNEVSFSANSIKGDLNELFAVFFPGKKFDGLRVKSGEFLFDVTTPSGARHDLDDLSSGEKEVLLGYLRLRNIGMQDSIILIDEPELHLNPRLVRGLPEFYRKHFGEKQKNQLWLVTHSDSMIREVANKPNFSVFHMVPCDAKNAAVSQLTLLDQTSDLNQVLTDLVGDLAAYRPGGKALIFEGGGDSDFDKRFVADLFREELRGINLISGTDKAKVKALHEILEKAYSDSTLDIKFCAIVDGDTDEEFKTNGFSRFQWNVYHVENYLLQPDIIAHILNSSELSKKWTDELVSQALKDAARLIIPHRVAHKMREYCNKKIVTCIDLGFSPKSKLIGSEIYQALVRSTQRITDVVAKELQESDLDNFEKTQRLELDESLEDGTWIKKLPGREILKQFRGDQKLPMTYELLRNLIIGRMSELGRKPEGMRKVIEEIRVA